MDLTLIVQLFASAGVGAIILAIVNHFLNKRKDVVDVTDINVETALKVESVMHERYMSALEKLQVAEELVRQSREDWEACRNYTIVLQNTLISAGIPVPPEHVPGVE